MNKPLISISAFILIFVLMGIHHVNAATETLTPSYTKKSEDQVAGGYLYSTDSQKNVTINIGNKPNMIIKRIYWDYGSGERDVPGDWFGKSSYTGTDSISGTSIMVKTPELARVNTIYYWDRSSMSNVWRSFGENVVYPTSVNCPAAPLDTWDLKRYPNCDDNRLPLNLTHTGSYTIDGLDRGTIINDKAIVKSTVHPVEMYSDTEQEVKNSTHGGSGYPDKSTQFVNFEVINERQIHIKYRQDFGNDSFQNGYYKDWAAPGARQMWYYGSFTFKFQATTYRYMDKQLKVEWMPKENEITQLNVRHMVRTGPTGSFAKAGELITTLAETIPFTRNVIAETTYGTVVGRNVSYSSYSNTVQSGNSITVNFSSTQKTAYVTFFYERLAPAFTGDFDIIPDTINYRESFAFVPKNFVMNGCTYQSHRYKIERNGTFTTSPVIGQYASTSYTYSTYPWIIGVGGHTVSINIKTTCGETGWINHKTLTVNDMAGNNPPRFRIGFVHPNAQTVPIHQVVEGSILNLIYIEDPSVPTPIDPDGDSLHFMGFDTENGTSFIKSIPEKYDEYTNGYHSVVMDTLGYHNVSAQMRDQWGLAATASTYIQVVPKNPIAIALCPPIVKSSRNVANSLFDASRSYSPLGRTIDHTKNEWMNKKAVYTNTTELNIIETVQLHVYDSAGLKSLDPAVCQIIVEPDQPPVAKLDVPSLAVRNQEIEIYNRSYSPDNDKIVSAEYQYKYDAANDGFENDNWQIINANSVLSFTFKPSKVGKYLFFTKVTEDYGRTDDTLDEEVQLLTLDVVNDSPTISFDMEGSNVQPDLDPVEPYDPTDIINDWKLYQVNSTSLMEWPEIKWFADGKTLAGSTGKMGETQDHYSVYRPNSYTHSTWAYPFSNQGLGYNNLSPYRAMQSLNAAKSQPLLGDRDRNGKLDVVQYYNSAGGSNFQMQIRSNESHFYYTEPSRDSGGDYYYPHVNPRLHAVNKSKIGRYRGQMLMPNNDPWQQYYDHTHLNGNPVDFVLGPEHLGSTPKPTVKQYLYKNVTDMRNKEISKATFMGERTLSYATINGYKIGEKTIYQTLIWDCNSRCSYYYDNGDAIYDSGLFDLRSYDAFTGEFVSSTLMTGTLDQSMDIWGTKGDNLIGAYKGSFIEINRKGTIVKTYPNFIKAPFSSNDYNNQPMICSPGIVKDAGYSERLLDGTDAWYYLEGTYCSPDSTQQYQTLHLVKVWKKDMKVAWRTKLKGRKLDGQGTNSYIMSDPSAFHEAILINEMKGEILVKSFTPNGHSFSTYSERINLVTGRIGDYNDVVDGPWSSSTSTFEMDWNGNYSRVGETRFPNVLTAEGWKTNYSKERQVYVRDLAGVTRNHFQSNATISGSWSATNSISNGIQGIYVGDGMYLALSTTQQGSNADFTPILHVGTPTTDPLIYDAFTLGQWLSENKLKDAELTFSMTMFQPKVNSKMAGMSFRMQNPMNRYALETDGQKLYLSKYIGGNRTVLASQNFTVQASKAYSFRILMQGDAIKVYMDGVPYFDITDSQYTDGYFGMFSDRGLVDFDKIGSKLTEVETWSTQYAIWEEEDAAAAIRTDNVIFDDPEDDPIAELGWSIFHTVRFINNQGLSALHNKLIEDGDLLLDKVGDYKVALKGRDDPHPNYLMPKMTFDEYRKDSNEFVRNITVHRRPIADFDVVQRGSDGMILWTDRSRDPDRYESATHYSDEDTGIDYRATKGVLEKRFYHITPSGEYIAEKIVAPQEIGKYEIGLAVKDEYGAWSSWAVRTLDVGKIAVPNTLPTPGFTKSHTTTYRGVPVTINSTASDLEDGGRENLAHTYYVRNKTDNTGETIRSNSRTSWTTTFNKLGTYTIRQLVEDSVGANAQTQQYIVIVNRKPTANITVPASINQNAPTKMTVFRPDFRWIYSDSDNDKQHRYQVQIYRYGGHLLHDSDVLVGDDATWKPNVDLPEKTNMYVQVRVHDGFEWGSWSTVKYFYIETNQPPTAGFTWSPNPLYEGDTVAFRNLASDPDRDPLTVSYELTSPSGIKRTYEYSHGYPYPATAPSYRMTEAGIWRMRQTVSDGRAAPVSLERTINVLPLSVMGIVRHTQEWDERRKSYNKQESGNEESPRGYSVYWAGEKFLLEADTTGTSTATLATKVEVTLGQRKTTLTPNDSLHTKWRGELWDNQLEELPDGPATFTFTAYYNNGTVKSANVVITIEGIVSGTVGVHRVK